MLACQVENRDRLRGLGSALGSDRSPQPLPRPRNLPGSPLLHHRLNHGYQSGRLH